MIISVALLYFSGWTYVILYRQKKAWKAFAARHKMRYIPGQFMDSPQVKGQYGGYDVHVFSSEHQSPDVRGFRKLTAVEITMKTTPPAVLVAASSGMVSLADLMDLPVTYVPEHDKWSAENVIRGNHRDMTETYFTPERLTSLQKLMSIKNAMMIYIARPETGILRIDLSDPLDDEGREEKLLKNLVKLAKILELGDGEEGKLKAASAKKVKTTPVLEVDDGAIEDTGLSLEDD